MKTIFIIIILVVGFAFVSEMSISFKPFNIQLPYWHRALGVFLVVIGFLISNVGERSKGYNDGLQEGVNLTIDLLKEKAKNKNIED